MVDAQLPLWWNINDQNNPLKHRLKLYYVICKNKWQLQFMLNTGNASFWIIKSNFAFVFTHAIFIVFSLYSLRQELRDTGTKLSGCNHLIFFIIFLKINSSISFGKYPVRVNCLILVKHSTLNFFFYFLIYFPPRIAFLCVHTSLYLYALIATVSVIAVLSLLYFTISFSFLFFATHKHLIVSFMFWANASTILY